MNTHEITCWGFYGIVFVSAFHMLKEKHCHPQVLCPPKPLFTNESTYPGRSYQDTFGRSKNGKNMFPNSGAATWKPVWWFRGNLELELPQAPATPLAGTCPKGMKTGLQRDSCTPHIHCSVTQICGKMWKQPKCRQSMDGYRCSVL